MYIILEVSGCLPYINVVNNPDGNGEALIFDTELEAKHFAEENCAWEYKVVEV